MDFEILFEVVRDEYRKHPNQEIIVPQRATNGSAGYDFFLPEDIIVDPLSSYIVWTDIKAKMPWGVVLKMYMRSSLGIKKNLMLANTVGIIDKDFYQNESNDGNIGLCIYNYSNVSRKLEKGTAICQGIFSDYYVTSDDIPKSEERVGGIGSTNS